MQSAARPRGVTTLRGGAGPAAVGAHMVGSILYTGDSDDSPLPLPVVGAKLRKGQDLVSRNCQCTDAAAAARPGPGEGQDLVSRCGGGTGTAAPSGGLVCDSKEFQAGGG